MCLIEVNKGEDVGNRIVMTATTLSPTITDFAIPSKTDGDSSFTITEPISNSDGLFTYTSSNSSVATISGNTITNVVAGNSMITATQAATRNYTSGTITTIIQVNPVSVDTSDKLLYYMNTSSIYSNLTIDLIIDYDLIASSYKVLTSKNNILRNK